MDLVIIPLNREIKFIIETGASASQKLTETENENVYSFPKIERKIFLRHLLIVRTMYLKRDLASNIGCGWSV